MLRQGVREQGERRGTVPAALPESVHFISLSSESGRFCTRRTETEGTLRARSPGSTIPWKPFKQTLCFVTSLKKPCHQVNTKTRGKAIVKGPLKDTTVLYAIEAG